MERKHYQVMLEKNATFIARLVVPYILYKDEIDLHKNAKKFSKQTRILYLSTTLISFPKSAQFSMLFISRGFAKLVERMI